MNVYRVKDNIEVTDRFFANKRAAMIYYDSVEAGSIEKIETVEPTKHGVLAMLNKEHYVAKRELIADK